MKSTIIGLCLASVALIQTPAHAQMPPPLKFVSNDGSVLTINPPTPANPLQLQGSYQDSSYRPKCQKSSIPVTVAITMDPQTGLPKSLNFTATYCNNAKKTIIGDFNPWTPGQQTVSFAASYTITGTSTYSANNPMPNPPAHPLVPR